MNNSLNTSPAQTCTLCGRVQSVRPDGRGFPPDIAKRKLAKACKAAGCPCKPQYSAGVSIHIRDLYHDAP